MDARELVERAIRREEEGRLDDAVAAWLAIARLIPTEPEAYERLFTIHVHRREVDAAFCAASVLASLDALEGTARELYDDYVPRRLPPRAARSLDAEDWALLRHPLEDPAVGERLAAALPKIRLKPASEDAIDMATLAWAASLLGANANDLPSDNAPPLVARADLEQLWRNYALRERLFFAGRAATALRVPAHLLVHAASRQIAEALGASSTDEIERWQIGVELTRARAGMLVCGELVVARELLVRENAGDAVLGELALFAVSPEHHRLRAKLGIAIGAAADAPADVPAPAAPAPNVPGVVQPRRPTADVIVRALVEPPKPPETVGALLDALEIALDAAFVDTSRLGPSAIDTTSRGTLVMPRASWAWLTGGSPHVAVRYAFDAQSEAPIASVAALRDRRVRAFSVVCFPRDHAEAILRARFGAGPETAGAKGDDYRTFGPWVFTAKSSQLGWFEDLPHWLGASAKARRAALPQLLGAISNAESRDELRALAARLPPDGDVRMDVDREGIELTLVPEIPVKMLDGLFVLGAIALRTADGAWVLRRLARPGETGPTMPLTMGPWTLVPRLSHPPTAGTAMKDNDDVHMSEALDVVTSIRIQAPETESARRWREIIDALAHAPPCIVGDLCAVLGVGLEALDLHALGSGTLYLPNVRVSLMPGDATERIGARAIHGWTATLSSGLADVESALTARFGPPIELLGDARYGPFAIRRTSAATGDLLHRTVTGGPATLTCLAPHRDGKLVAVGDAAGRLRVWSPAKGRVVALHLLGSALHAIDWPEDCFQLVVHLPERDELRVFSDDGIKHAPDPSVVRPRQATSCRVPGTKLRVACGVDALLRVSTESGEEVGAVAFDDYGAKVVEPSGVTNAAEWWASAVRAADR